MSASTFYFVLFFRPFHSFLMLLWQLSQAHNFHNTNNIEVKNDLDEFQWLCVDQKRGLGFNVQKCKVCL